MSKKLHIHLNDLYKSFPAGFEQDFLGDLIILSGINGSGKTQLTDIIKGYISTDTNQHISRTLTLDGAVLDQTLIAHKSFRDYSSIGELTNAEVGVSYSEISTIFEWYRQYRLDYNRNEVSGYRDACKRAKNILIERFGQVTFDNGSITREQIKDTLPKNFVLFQDDIFTNKIGQIFFKYVSLVHNKQAEAGATGNQFDITALPLAPWKTLNDLFEKLGFEYRFKDNYERLNDEISEQPTIYALGEDGRIDLRQKRSLSDLSDGEKALISLTFAILASEQTKPKLLLLDEYDATLNPSLTQAFFIILEEFFVAKGIQVIVVTHSSSTLSLAPEYSYFYEVYKPKNNRPRVLQVQRDQYAELAIANKKFYEKIEDQDTRYAEVQAENEALKEVVQRLQRPVLEQKLQIITEGKNGDHIKKALELLAPELLGKIDIVTGVENKSGSQQLKNAFEVLSNVAGAPKTLYVWDWDAFKLVDGLADLGSCYKFCFVKNDTNTLMVNGIENLYTESIFTDEVYTETTEAIMGGKKTLKMVDKNKVLAKINLSHNADDFANFTSLVDKIRSLTRETV